jgi:hypothetical protein
MSVAAVLDACSMATEASARTQFDPHTKALAAAKKLDKTGQETKTRQDKTRNKARQDKTRQKTQEKPPPPHRSHTLVLSLVLSRRVSCLNPPLLLLGKPPNPPLFSFLLNGTVYIPYGLHPCLVSHSPPIPYVFTPLYTVRLQT